MAWESPLLRELHADSSTLCILLQLPDGPNRREVVAVLLFHFLEKTSARTNIR